MNAEQMFKELGYAKKNTGYSNIICYEKDASIRNLPHIIGTQFALNDEHVSMYSIFGKEAEFGAFNYLDVKLLNAINKQCKELGWLESEFKQETNLYRYFEDLLKTGGRYAFVNGKIKHCWGTRCCDCAFNGGNCNKEKIKWAASPYEKQTYKLTQFEYDLLQHFSVDFKFKEMGLLKEMKEKGHFKNINGDELIKDILESCEVIK